MIGAASVDILYLYKPHTTSLEEYCYAHVSVLHWTMSTSMGVLG